MEIEEFAEKLHAWHANKVEQLRLITDNRDAVIEIRDMKIDPCSLEAKGFRLGIAIALELLGELPFSISCSEDADVD